MEFTALDLKMVDICVNLIANGRNITVPEKLIPAVNEKLKEKGLPTI